MGSDGVRVGVIGAGAIAPSHVDAIERASGASLAAVCDPVPGRAAALAGKHGARAFTSVEEMLAAGGIDAVTICTPSGLHLEAALAVIAAGRHLLVEKPLEITTARVDQVIEAAARAGVILAGVFQSRYRPMARRMKELIDGGILGRVYAGSAYIKRYRTQEYYDSGGWRGTWAIDGGGCLMNQGIHMVDLLLWFMGRAEAVAAFTDSVGRRVEVETLAMGLVRFGSGAKGLVEATTLAFPELPQYLEIFGERGTATFNGDQLWRLDLRDPSPGEEAVRRELFKLSGRLEAEEQERQAGAEPGTAVPSVDMGHAPVVQDFVDAIREGRPPQVDGTEARRAVALITAIYASGREGGRLVEVIDR